MSIHFCSSSPTKETKKSTATSIGCVRQVTEKSAHQMYIGFWIACESKEWANIHSKYALDDHCGISSLISILLTICSWLHAFCIQNDSHQFQAATYTPVCMHAAWKITFCEQFLKALAVWSANLVHKNVYSIFWVNSTLSFPVPARNSKHFILNSNDSGYVTIISARNFATESRQKRIQWNKQCERSNNPISLLWCQNWNKRCKHTYTHTKDANTQKNALGKRMDVEWTEQDAQWKVF